MDSKSAVPIALYRLAVVPLVETEAFHFQLSNSASATGFHLLMQAVPSTDPPGALIHLAISVLQPFSDRTKSHQQPTSFSFVFFVTKEI